MVCLFVLGWVLSIIFVVRLWMEASGFSWQVCMPAKHLKFCWHIAHLQALCGGCDSQCSAIFKPMYFSPSIFWCQSTYTDYSSLANLFVLSFYVTFRVFMPTMITQSWHCNGALNPLHKESAEIFSTTRLSVKINNGHTQQHCPWAPVQANAETLLNATLAPGRLDGISNVQNAI